MSEKIIIGEKRVIHSEILGEDRKILIRLPKGYENSKQRYPVLYLLDAEFFFQQATAAVEFLSECEYLRNKPIPQMIIVGIVNIDRNRDYTPTHAPEQLEVLRFPTSGKADKFLKFIKNELFPFVEKNYRTQPYRILSGWSLGGLLTVHTYFEQPGLFSSYLAISPSLWWDNDLFVEKTNSLINQGKISNKPLVVTIGTLEGGNIGRTVRDGFIPLMNEKSENGKFFKSIEIPDEEHSYVPYKAIYDGLKVLYSDWMITDEIVNKGIKAIESFHQELSKKYGYKIDIPESTYSRLSNNLHQQGEEYEALEIAKIYVQKYAKSSYAHYYLGIRYQLVGDIDLAKECFEKALELEKKHSDPDSERIVMYTIKLQDIEKEIKKG